MTFDFRVSTFDFREFFWLGPACFDSRAMEEDWVALHQALQEKGWLGAPILSGEIAAADAPVRRALTTCYYCLVPPSFKPSTGASASPIPSTAPDAVAKAMPEVWQQDVVIRAVRCLLVSVLCRPDRARSCTAWPNAAGSRGPQEIRFAGRHPQCQRPRRCQ